MSPGGFVWRIGRAAAGEGGYEAIEARPRPQHNPLAHLLIAGFTWPSRLDRVQSTINLRQHALDLFPLVRAGTFLQPFDQPLLLRKQFCNRGHLLTNPGFW